MAGARVRREGYHTCLEPTAQPHNFANDTLQYRWQIKRAWIVTDAVPSCAVNRQRVAGTCGKRGRVGVGNRTQRGIGERRLKIAEVRKRHLLAQCAAVADIELEITVTENRKVSRKGGGVVSTLETHQRTRRIARSFRRTAAGSQREEEERHSNVC